MKDPKQTQKDAKAKIQNHILRQIVKRNKDEIALLRAVKSAYQDVVKNRNKKDEEKVIEDLIKKLDKI